VLAVARAALDAREFAKARAVLASHLAAPTRRIALLMAELERAERNDEGRAREWLSRALHAAPDPAWTADGHVSDRWLPVSPVTGRLDAFEWRVPLTGIAGTVAVIEPEPAAEPPPVVQIAAAPQPQQQEDTVAAVESETAPFSPAPVPDADTAPAAPPPQPKSPPVIPLVHAPDDPGPETVEESPPPAETKPNGWRSIFK
jgi:HemY protein